ncbi:MAG: TylF/MycF/NovP-related O-methyltransferase [Sulfuricellaceae bacterium]
MGKGKNKGKGKGKTKPMSAPTLLPLPAVHAERYLSLLKKSLLNQLYLENEARLDFLLDRLLMQRPVNLEALIPEYLGIRDQPVHHNLEAMRKNGRFLGFFSTDGKEILFTRNFSFVAHTMIGQARLDNIQQCLDTIIAEKVPGDLIETGVWKGGATVFMRGYLMAHNIRKRRVWVADSFAGLPKADCAQDRLEMDCSADTLPYLAVSQEAVESLFARYDLLDDKVKFLKGWFKDTLPTAPIKKLALLRLDGDLYESTMDGLNNLYHKVSPGGFVIVDDYHAVPACKVAVDEFRARHAILEPLETIDHSAVYWRKSF